MGLSYLIQRTDIMQGEQFQPGFMDRNPNAKIPVVVDHDLADGGPAVTVFESSAILLYLAEKTGQFLPPTIRARQDVLMWMFW